LSSSSSATSREEEGFMWKARGRLDVQREEEGSTSMSSHKMPHTVPVASTAARQAGSLARPGHSASASAWDAGSLVITIRYI
jgi:hypothetical protein